MMRNRTSILLVEDDPEVAEMFVLGLSIAGHDVEMAGDGRRAFERANQQRFDLVLLEQIFAI